MGVENTFQTSSRKIYYRCAITSRCCGPRAAVHCNAFNSLSTSLDDSYRETIYFRVIFIRMPFALSLYLSRSYVSHCHRNPCVICGSHSVDVFSAAHLQRISFRDALVRCEDYGVTICTDLRLKRTTYESHPKSRTKKNFTTLRIVTFRWAQWKGRSKRIETTTATITNRFIFQFFFCTIFRSLKEPREREKWMYMNALWIRLAAAAGSITNTFHITDRFSCLFANILCKCKARITLFVFMERSEDPTAKDFLFAVPPMRSALRVLSYSPVRKSRHRENCQWQPLLFRSK